MTPTPADGPIRRRGRGWRAWWPYARAMLYEFRWSLGLAVLLVAFAATCLWFTPHAQLGGQRPSLAWSIYGGWMALLAQPILSPPDAWYLVLIDGVYPLFGFLIVGEGIVHFAMLMLSRRRGEKEWMRVMASTYKDHVILCGMGRLGIRVLEQLLEQGRDVVVIEKDEDSPFLTAAKATGVPVLIRDMTEDQALIEAGVPRARAIVVATNNDVANLEVAMDARRMNPGIHVSMRLFDQRMAEKLANVFAIDHAFSSSALAAPAVAGMALGLKLMSSCKIAGVTHGASELEVAPGSRLSGQTLAQLESGHGARVLAHTPKNGTVHVPPDASAALAAGDKVVVHASLLALGKLADAARPA